MKKNQILLCLMVISMFQSPCMTMEPDNSSDLPDDILRYFVTAASLTTFNPNDPKSWYTSVSWDSESKTASAEGTLTGSATMLGIDSWQPSNQVFQNGNPLSSYRLPGEFNPKIAYDDFEKIIKLSPIASSTKGSVLAAAAQDKTIVIFDSSNPDPKVLKNSSLSSALAYTPDDSKLISGSTDKGSTIKIWNIATQKVIKEIPKNASSILSISCTPDNLKFVTGSENGTITLWNLTTGTPLTTFTNHSAAVKTLTFNTDGSELAAGFADGTLEIITMQTNDINTLIPPQPVDMTDKFKRLAAAVVALRYNPNKPELICISGKPTLTIWNTNMNTCDATVELCDTLGICATISPDCSKFSVAPFWIQTQLIVYDLDLIRKLINPRCITPGQMDVLNKIVTPEFIAKLKQADKNSPPFKFLNLTGLIIGAFEKLSESDQQTLQQMGFPTLYYKKSDC